MGTAAREATKKEKCLKEYKEDPKSKQKEKVRPCWAPVVVVAGLVCFVLLFVSCFFFEAGFHCSFGVCPGTSSCRPGWLQTQRDPPASAS